MRSEDDPLNTKWGPKPYPAVTFSHAIFWFAALSSAARLGPETLWYFGVFELFGLELYSRWLLGQRPYDKGANSDTMRSA
jgi:hypothetical protein